MEDQINVRVVRRLAEVEDIRQMWVSWQCHPNSDIDFYLNVLRSSPEALQAHVMVLYRNGRPEAMLVGRLERTQFDLRIGYGSLLKTKPRVLSFVYGGQLGNLSRENSEAMVGEIMNSLRRGEADIAWFNHIQTEVPLYSAATRSPGFSSRDYFPTVRAHWTMRLPDSLEEVYQGLSKDHRWEVRRKAKKLLADYPDKVQVTCFRGIAELERMISDIEEVAKKTYQRGLGVAFADTPQMRQRLRLEAEKGWLRAYVLYVADRPCAFWTGSFYGGTFHSNYLGYDKEFGKYSPGTFLLMRMIKDFCGDGVREIDFGLGNARYKQRFGNCSWQEASVYIFSPAMKGFALNVLRTLTMFIDQLMKKALERTRLLAKVKRTWRQHAIKE